MKWKAKHPLEQMSHQELYSCRCGSRREVLEGRVSIRENPLRKVLLTSLVDSLSLCFAAMKTAQVKLDSFDLCRRS